MISCYWVLEGFCTLKLEYQDIQRCDFESTKEDEISGLCNAKESDLTEICGECEEQIDSCLCSEELDRN